MTKVVSQHELDALVELVGQFPNGAGIDDLRTTIGHDISHRTLQRRVANLVAQGRLIAIGIGRGRTYRLALNSGQGSSQIHITSSGTAEAYVPISSVSEQVKAYVRQPIQQRTPVPYQQLFLEAYTPNVTEYIPRSLRDQLHAIGRPPIEVAPAGTFAREILDRLLIDLSWASSRLEGNTYTRLDTEQLIQFGRIAQGKDALETQMILNHKAAIEYLINNADQLAIDRHTIFALHSLLSDDLLRDPKACGTLRTRSVRIGGSVYTPPVLPQRVEELFGFILEMATEITDPFEQAFFLMVHLPYLQPFEDVNKRVSRLAANIPLIRHNLCPLSFIDVPERAYVDGLLGVYETNQIELLRDVFIWAYERSCQQYAAVQSQLIPPDTFRLKYRTALSETIRAIIHNSESATTDIVKRYIPSSVSRTDHDQFVELVLREFMSLHAGNAIRFGIHPFEFEGWAKAIRIERLTD